MQRYEKIPCPACGKLVGEGVPPRIETQRLRLWCKDCKAKKEIVIKPRASLKKVNVDQEVSRAALAQAMSTKIKIK